MSAKTYRANCHCGAFIYEVQLPEITVVGECDCALCIKKGYLWLVPESDADLTIAKGTIEELTSYTFGDGGVTHKFCRTCGTALMTLDTSPKGASSKFSLNAHAIQGINTWNLEKKPFKCGTHGYKHNPASYSGPEPTAKIDGGKLYKGSCHCGAITLAVKSEPLDATYPKNVFRCNCSICERNAYIWMYPGLDQVLVQGQENWTAYSFNHGFLLKPFCSVCGVHPTTECANLSQDELEALSEDGRMWHTRVQTMHPVNIRVLDNFDLGGIRVKDGDGAGRPTPYVNP